MKRKAAKILLPVLLASLMTACAQTIPLENTGTAEFGKNIRHARVEDDHDALSRYFEKAAKEMQAKAAEQRKLLEHYEDKSYLYGRSAQDLKSHTAALIRKYEETAEKNIKEAATHRQMALEQVRQNTVAARGARE